MTSWAAVRAQVVFSEAWWVGTKAENPEERRLPMPAEVEHAKIHDEADCEWLGALSRTAAAFPSPKLLGSVQHTGWKPAYVWHSA